MMFENNRNFAIALDRQDSLQEFRQQFVFPTTNGQNSIYFCGNSLGLQPKETKNYLATELEDWGRLGVEGHFHGSNPWFEYHKYLKSGLKELVGANSLSEVTPMGSLTTNLHLLMVSFFRPTTERYKIIIEAGAFPSDQYAIETQCNFHGIDPEDAIIELDPGRGKYLLESSEITDCISAHSDQLALVILSGVQYFTGQFFDIKTITQAGHQVGAMVGWDLAHAIGNVPLSLHDHEVDFAVWCSYKYLNSGPGGTAGIFVHDRHGNNPGLTRFGGWWGYPEDKRFEMNKGFEPTTGSDGWQLSNANVLSMAAQKASLDVFQNAGFDNLREKSVMLTGYLDYLLEIMEQNSGAFQVVTPKDPDQRGCQLSLLFKDRGRDVFNGLTAHGVVVDWREPNVIRVAPTPLYNSFEEIYDFSQILENLIG